jgi:hypothetical protein
MTLTIQQTYRQSELTNYSTQFGAAAQICIFSGTAPADADTAYSSNAVLVGLPYTVTTPFGAPTAAKPSVITANAITQTNVYGTGTATFFRSFAQGTSGITGAGFVVGNTYMVQTPGTSTLANYQSIGLSAGITSLAAGQLFIATGTTLTGSGTAYLMNCIEQGTVGTSGADLNLNTVSLVAGGPLQVTSLTRSM